LTAHLGDTHGRPDDATSSETDDVTTSFTYTNISGGPQGLLQTMTDPLGHVTRYQYGTTPASGSFGRVTSATSAYGTAEAGTVEYQYDSAGNVTAAIDELGRETDFVYDDLDRETQMIEPSPDGVQSRPVTQYQYNALG
jgi:YD repeat-containing protein